MPWHCWKARANNLGISWFSWVVLRIMPKIPKRPASSRLLKALQRASGSYVCVPQPKVVHLKKFLACARRFPGKPNSVIGLVPSAFPPFMMHIIFCLIWGGGIFCSPFFLNPASSPEDCKEFQGFHFEFSLLQQPSSDSLHGWRLWTFLFLAFYFIHCFCF